MFRLEMIVAFNRNGGIGVNGTIPWHVPDDLEHFKRVTKDNTVIMGRKTYESLPDSYRPLPGRRNVILSSNPEYKQKGAHVYPSLFHVLKLDNIQGTPYIVGGGQLYAETLPFVDRVYATLIDDESECDTFFPVDFLKSDYFSLFMVQGLGAGSPHTLMVFDRNKNFEV